MKHHITITIYKKTLFILSFIFILPVSIIGQNSNFSTDDSSNQLLFTGLSKPRTLNIHHFGIFISRIESNFSFEAVKKATFNFSISSSNLWLPPIKAYLPLDVSARTELEKTVWFQRNFKFVNQQETPMEVMELVSDAVIKSFVPKFKFKISKKTEFEISIRSHLVTNGKMPFSLFTSDKLIEFIHSNIQGSEDPFGRKYYGMDKAIIDFTDRRGNNMTLKNGDFIISGIESNFFFYPKWPFKNQNSIYHNLGLHIGTNTHKFNQSIDLGFSYNLMKILKLNKKANLSFGWGNNILRKRILSFNEGISFTNNNFLFNTDLTIELSKKTIKNNIRSYGLNYHYQSRYNKKSELDYIVLRGDWSPLPTTWMDGFFTLYEPLEFISFYYSIKNNKRTISFYFTEDLFINNAPDFQTGFSIAFPLK